MSDGTLQGVARGSRHSLQSFGRTCLRAGNAKDIAKIVLKAAQAPVPGGMYRDARRRPNATLLPPPYVIKPVAEGSSVGVFMVRRRRQHEHPPQESNCPDWAFGERVVVEPYIPGKELTCAVMGRKRRASSRSAPP